MRLKISATLLMLILVTLNCNQKVQNQVASKDSSVTKSERPKLVTTNPGIKGPTSEEINRLLNVDYKTQAGVNTFLSDVIEPMYQLIFLSKSQLIVSYLHVLEKASNDFKSTNDPRYTALANRIDSFVKIYNANDVNHLVSAHWEMFAAHQALIGKVVKKSYKIEDVEDSVR